MIPALQYLRHGKALCGKVFKRFVETFNYHNDFIANLKGDGDLSTSDGCINLDRTDPTHPVIRLNRNNLGGESSAPAPSKNDVGLFRLGKKEPEPGEEPSDNLWLFNTYLRLGSSWVRMNGNTEIDTGTPVESYANQFLFLTSSTTIGSHGPEFFVNMTGDFSDIERDSRDPTTIVIPLYHFDENGAVDIDFRIGAGTDAFDLSPIESVNDRYNQ